MMRPILAAILLCGGLGGANGANAQNLDFTARWNALVARRDAPGMAALYTRDALWLAPNAPVARGRAVARAFYASLFENPSLSLVHTPVRVTVSASEDVATEVGTYRLRLNTPEGSVRDRGKYTLVWVHEGGAWRIASDIFNSSNPVRGNP